MSQALLTGVSGLLSHQNKLDVVANNLANINTTSYKAQRILFSDLMYTNIRNATAGDNRLSGTNPLQKGFGAGVSTTSRNFSQGVLSATGQTFDFAIEGDGFFILDSNGQRYTRAGAFTLDRDGFLVDGGTGGFVQRIGTMGEGLDGSPAFQIRGDNRIQVPLGAGIIGNATSQTNFFGNLPAGSSPAAAEILTSSNPFMNAGAPATMATLLNDLDSNLGDYIAGDQIRLSGFDFLGNAIDSNFDVDETTTLGDLVNQLSTLLPGASVSLTPTGAIMIQADQAGESKHRIEFNDMPGNTGGTRFNQHPFVESVKGKENDFVESIIQVFDERGQSHAMNVRFEKTAGNSWDAFFELLDSSGEVLNGTVRRIEFSENGLFLGTFGSGDDSNTIEVQFPGMNFSQTIEIEFENMTHLGTGFVSSVNQDGFPPGNLATVGVGADGRLEGIATNGRRIPLAQLAIANFFNVQGLEAVGQNYFRETVNSGVAQIGVSQSGSAGIVRGGQLETSNVDVALEFTQLIVAQRGFSANARTITVASEVLQELNNIIR